MTLQQEISANYQRVLQQVEAATAESQRPSGSVQVVVVSKKKSAEVILAAMQAGISTFGENYAEEAVEKMQQLGEHAAEAHWHMIGHIQSRKASLVAAHFEAVHSIDTFRIAEKISQQAVTLGKTIQVMLECNVSGEEAKFGFAAKTQDEWEGVLQNAIQIAQLPGLQLCGLMTMPPLLDDVETSRPYFARLRNLRDWLQTQNQALKLPQLSMGTSSDFIPAIKEGATMVRIGTAILGERVYL